MNVITPSEFAREFMALPFELQETICSYCSQKDLYRLLRIWNHSLIQSYLAQNQGCEESKLRGITSLFEGEIDHIWQIWVSAKRDEWSSCDKRKKNEFEHPCMQALDGNDFYPFYRIYWLYSKTENLEDQTIFKSASLHHFDQCTLHNVISYEKDHPHSQRYPKHNIVKALVYNRADTNTKDENGLSPLHLAVRLHRKKSCTPKEHSISRDMCRFLARFTDLSGRCKKDNTALHDAVLNGDKELVKMLLRKGANVNAVSRSEGGPLHCAVKSYLSENSSLKMIELLIENKAKVNLKDSKKQTPLALAANLFNRDPKDNKRVAVAKKLIRLGAQPYKAKAESARLLRVAALIKDVPLVKQLVKKGAAKWNMNEQRYAMKPIHAAVYFGEKPISSQDVVTTKALIKLLVENGADVNGVYDLGDTPLQVAIRQLGNGYDTSVIKIVEELVQRGANVNRRGAFMNTPLHSAAYQLSIEMVQLLVEKGAIVHIRNSNQHTPLDSAIVTISQDSSRFLENIKSAKNLITYLTEKGATPSRANIQACLSSALKDLCFERVQLLVENLKIDLSQSEKYPPLQLVMDSFIEIAKSPAGDDRRITEEAQKAKELIEYLVAKGASTDVVCSEGDRPLHAAIKTLGHKYDNLVIEIIEKLVNCGADVNAPGNGEETPLHLAAKHCSLKVAKLFVDSGARIDPLNSGKQTPLEIVELEIIRDTEALKRGLGGDDKLEGLRTQIKEYLTHCEKQQCRTGAETKSVPRETALHRAIRDGDLKESRKLLKKNKSDVQVATEGGQLPIHLAFDYYGDDSFRWNAIILLIRGGADVRAKYKGRTVLHMAVDGNEATLAAKKAGRLQKFKNCFDVNSYDLSGNTALHIATEKGFLGAVRRIVEMGADIKKVNINNETAGDIARKICYQSIGYGKPDCRILEALSGREQPLRSATTIPDREGGCPSSTPESSMATCVSEADGKASSHSAGKPNLP